MNKILISPLLLFLLVAPCCSGAQAQSVQLAELNERVSPGSRVTYLDFPGKIFPGARDERGVGGESAGRSIA